MFNWFSEGKWNNLNNGWFNKEFPQEFPPELWTRMIINHITTIVLHNTMTRGLVRVFTMWSTSRKSNTKSSVHLQIPSQPGLQRTGLICRRYTPRWLLGGCLCVEWPHGLRGLSHWLVSTQSKHCAAKKYNNLLRIPKEQMVLDPQGTRMIMCVRELSAPV